VQEHRSAQLQTAPVVVRERNEERREIREIRQRLGLDGEGTPEQLLLHPLRETGNFQPAAVGRGSVEGRSNSNSNGP